jgi:hypothetical protein
MVPDCNAHGVADSCDIANGMRDKNAEGHPDECSYAYGDFDLDGMIGAADLTARLSRRSLCKLDCSNFSGRFLTKLKFYFNLPRAPARPTPRSSLQHLLLELAAST